MIDFSGVKRSLRSARNIEGLTRFSLEQDESLVTVVQTPEVERTNARLVLMKAGLNVDQITDELMDRYLRGEWQPRRLRLHH